MQIQTNVMNGEHDKNYISVGQWMLWLLLAAIPCIGLIVVIVMAFVGENDSRKNYFRALIAWAVILIIIVGLLALLGGGLPAIQQEIQRRMSQG